MRLLTIFMMAALAAAPAFAAGRSFPEWLAAFRAEALRGGISQRTVDSALTGLGPLQKVIALDRKQPEHKITFAQYRKNVISQARIEKGRALLARHRAALENVEREYGVAPQYVVALWGMETSYGENTGGFGVVPALATLAWEGRRGDFFKGELLQALRIIDEGHIDAAHMRGSWAGAMGQNQFMPSSFKAFAVDADGDGRKDIWGTQADVFASTANYLARSGWKDGERWGRRVTLPKGFPQSLIGLEVKKPLMEWVKLGVHQPDGQPPPVIPGMDASLVAPDGAGGPVYLVYDNYRAVMKWNRSTYFATSVGLLADAIAGGPQ